MALVILHVLIIPELLSSAFLLSTKLVNPSTCWSDIGHKGRKLIFNLTCLSPVALVPLLPSSNSEPKRQTLFPVLSRNMAKQGGKQTPLQIESPVSGTLLTWRICFQWCFYSKLNNPCLETYNSPLFPPPSPNLHTWLVSSPCSNLLCSVYMWWTMVSLCFYP